VLSDQPQGGVTGYKQQTLYMITI